MIPLADTPTLGLLIGLPVTILILAGLAGALVAVRGRDTFPDFTPGEVKVFTWGAFVAAAVTVIVAGIAFWPWKYEYHFWQPKGGVVEKVSKRLVRAGEGMEEKVVLVIDGRPYGVTDTRATLVREGDRVDISCKRAYQWGSSDHGWDCRWGG